ncbi:MAK10-like protein [Tanacetum coccineum]|uniref:MAK10-like protein n=1 Tax=Tanacetum coccineum TaxID=301880 RepID=A0ABQ4WUN4_9ASTR
MWYLFDPTPSDCCKTDAHSTDFAESITTWEDLTTRFLAQFFPPGRTAKLHNDILMFQQHHGESLSEAWTHFKDLLQKSLHHDIDLWLQKNSWALIEDLKPLLYNESWNDPRDFAKPIKVIALPQDVPSTSDRCLIELENKVQRLMESHLAPTQPTHVNKITTSCEICSGPHDTQYCMEDPEQSFVEYASSRTDEARGLVSNFMASQVSRLSKFEADFKQQQSEMTNKIDTVLKAITDRIAGTLPSDTQPDESQVNKPDIEHEEKGNLGNTNSNPHPQPNTLASITTEQIIRDDDGPQNESPNKGEGATTEGPTVEYFDTFPIRDELTCHKRKLDPKENANGGVSNFTGRIKGMHVFVGNFTYIVDFMIIEDISSIIDPRLSHVVLGKPFVEISNMTHDPPEGVVRFIDGNDEVAYKMPHKIEQYNSLSNLEKEHIKSVYLKNNEDKRRGVDYAMNKILGFYKECLELGPEYITRLEEEGEVMNYLMESSAGNFSSKTKISFSENVETASRFTRDAVTTTPVMASGFS